MKRNINAFFGLIVILFFLFIFRQWLMSSVIASGDYWYYFKSMYGILFLHPYSWYQTTLPSGLGGQGFAYTNVITLVAFVFKLANIFNLSWETASKIFFYGPFMFLSFGSSVLLIKKILPNNRFWFIAPIVFALNTYILMMTGGGQIITGLSYALSPITLYLFINIIDSKNLNKIDRIIPVILSVLFLSLQILIDLRIAFVTVLAIFIYLLFSFIHNEFKNNFKSVFFVFSSFFITGLISAYWLFPLVLFGIDPIKQLGVDYSSVGIVKFLSFAKLENSIGLMHPYWPENIFGKMGFMKPEFLILPLLAFSSLLFIKKESKPYKYVLFFTILGIVGIFLGKGANEPFGSLYLWLFSYIPGFQLFRDSFKWYTLIAISYSILIPFAIDNIYEGIKIHNKFSIFNFPHFTKVSRGKQFSIKSKFFNLQNLFALLIIAYFLFLLRPAILGQLPGTFKKQSVPTEYKQLESYLAQDKTFYRTLWIPNAQLFGYYLNNNPEVSARDFFREYGQKKLLEKVNSSASQQLLNYSGIKYVIIPLDSENEIYLTDRKPDAKKYQKIVDSLDKISWIKKDKEFGKIVVYKTQESKDHFWCNCGASVSYQFINPTKYLVEVQNFKNGDRLIFSESFDNKWIAFNDKFSVNSIEFDGKFNSFGIPDGNYSFVVYYSPQRYVDLGTKISIVAIFGSLLVLVCLIVVKKKTNTYS